MDLSELRGGVAVVTGSASGIGFALAKQCQMLGMHVVLSDVRELPLDRAVKELQEAKVGEGRVEGFTCDVTKQSSVEDLLRKTQLAFVGLPIQFVAANAGIMFAKSTVISGTPEEWDLTYKVNVFGVANTLRTFVPVLMQQQKRSIVEITASTMGCIYGLAGPYGSSKLASLGVAEAFYFELQQTEARNKITVVALCPGFVLTEIRESGQEVTGGAIKSMEAVENDKASTGWINNLQKQWKHGMTADYCAEQALQYARDGKFYCILGNEGKEGVGIIPPNDIISNRSASMCARGYPGSGSMVNSAKL